ncbi:MAG: c-type cytochrome [Bacteroidia bacterium]|nr:c-type cytochrome [Bacteroidia bacterium]
MNTIYKAGIFMLLSLLVAGIYITVNDTIPQNTPIQSTQVNQKPENKDDFWTPPTEAQLAEESNAEQIKYGRELIQHTSIYLGPKGKVAKITNGMNCQNCHLDAGTKVWGNNYAAVASTYPKFRERSGATETMAKRVNDCMERSLNGKALDTNGTEMKAILSYINWLGTKVKKGDKPKGSGIYELAFLDRPANPEKGKALYAEKCQSCHQPNGTGLLNETGNEFVYPPLWGKQSYNQGAGLFRLSRFAGFIKTNMPLGASHKITILSDEEAWDIAAFVNSQPRPSKDLSKDWPNIAGKPIDHPLGPFTDGFSEKQHKYGPFQPIKKKKEQLAQQKNS